VNFYHFYEQNIHTSSVLKLGDNLILPLLVLTWFLNQVMIYSEGQVPCVDRLQKDNQWIAYGSLLSSMAIAEVQWLVGS
jgi:hypothetical protein